MSNIPNITFHDGHTMPQLGFGIWQVAKDEAEGVIKSAIDLGYRLIDGAWVYGNEQGQGDGFRASGVARDDVFLTTKVWNNAHGAQETRASVQRSLETIGVDQLDLVLIHWPVPSQDKYVDAWKSLIDLRNEGLIRSIGVSNFNADHLDRIIAETNEVPVLNQIEVNPGLQQVALCEYCAAQNIVVQAWTPLGGGRHFDAAPITEAAKRAGKSPAQVILRWLLQRGLTTITRSTNAGRQAESLDIFDFTLTDDEMAKIATLDVGLRSGPDPSVFKMM